MVEDLINVKGVGTEGVRVIQKSIGGNTVHEQVVALGFQDIDVPSITRVDERITQIVMTDGSETLTIDITRDGSGRITAINRTIS